MRGKVRALHQQNDAVAAHISLCQGTEAPLKRRLIRCRMIECHLL